MKENLYLPAEKLDTYLCARQRGIRVVRPALLSPQTIQLADDLIQLASSCQPDPHFNEELENRLQLSAQTSFATSVGKGLNFTPKLLTEQTSGQVKRRPFMLKRSFYSLVGAAALIIILVVAVPMAIKYLSPVSQPVAMIPSVTEAIVISTSTPETVITPESVTPTVPVLPDKPPMLPVLANWINGGYGGGGQPIAQNRQFSLDIELPAEPTQATACLLRQGDPTTTEYIQSVTIQLGMDQGQVYTWGAVQGSRVVQFGPTREFYYTDKSVLPENGLWSYPPHSYPSTELANSVARAFLESHQLLGFDYRSEVRDEVVSFYRLIDGQFQTSSAFARVIVSVDGKVGAVQYDPRLCDAMGVYPLISASEAWQMLMAGEPAAKLLVYTYPVVSANTKTWQRSYPVGQRAELFSNLQVQSSGDVNGVPFITAANLIVSGIPADLQRLAQDYEAAIMQSGDIETPIHIWGTVQDLGGYRALQLEGWDLTFTMDPMAGWQDVSGSTYNVSGVIQRQNGLALLQTDSGDALQLPDLPESITEGMAVFVQGGRIGDQFEWSRIQEKPVDWTPPDPNAVSLASVEKVELVYLSPETSMINSGTPDDLRTLMPAWCFSGQTDDGLRFQAYVQAVGADALKSE